MENKELTLSEIIELKREMDVTIRRAVYEFISQTGLVVENISISYVLGEEDKRPMVTFVETKVTL